MGRPRWWAACLAQRGWPIGIPVYLAALSAAAWLATLGSEVPVADVEEEPGELGRTRGG